MKTVMIKNFTSLPASFVAVSDQSESPLYTRAKLKVFYVGETADHRLFTKEFSDKLLETIGYTPVVSKYNTEKDDFEGHAAEQQIYGIVDPIIAPTFEEENGVIWAVCDVILYTERPDNTGSIAQKIIGQPQSLELKADTVQYKINRDPQTGKFQNIEFTDGQFIGVSVLGKSQDPAFTGSAFFDVKEFNKQFEQIKEYCDTRGETMNVIIPTFVEQSWGEKQKYVVDALDAAHGQANTWLIDMYDDFCVYYLYNEQENKVQLMKSTYTCEVKEGGCEVTLGDPIPVRVVYEDMSSQPIQEETQPVTPVTEESRIDTAGVTNADIESVLIPAENTPDSTIVTSEPPAPVQMEVEPKVNNNEETTTNTASLVDSEKEELAAYRRQDKLSLIDSFKETIPEKELEVYTSKVDEYSKEDLRNALNDAFVRNFKNRPQSTIGFSWAPEQKPNSEISEDDRIAQEMREKNKHRGNK